MTVKSQSGINKGPVPGPVPLRGPVPAPAPAPGISKGPAPDPGIKVPVPGIKGPVPDTDTAGTKELTGPGPWTEDSGIPLGPEIDGCLTRGVIRRLCDEEDGTFFISTTLLSFKSLVCTS